MDFINKGKNGEIILSDGKDEARFEFLEMYVLDSQEYAVLLSEDDEIIVMKFTESEGNTPEIYSVIEDDDIFEKIVSLYECDEE